MTIALEMYYLDNNNRYPAWSTKKKENLFRDLKDPEGMLRFQPTFTLPGSGVGVTLTTPISYIPTYYKDGFSPVKDAPFCYWGDNGTTFTGYVLWSAGPDGDYDLNIHNIAEAYQPHFMLGLPYLLERTYDPSNGADSSGDIYRTKE